MANWLRENHPIYAGKSATEANQFRGYLLYLLADGPPNAELLSYVKNELLFAGHAFNLAAAAHAAKIFKAQAPDLVALLLPFLQNDYQEEWIDISTYELHYPLRRPTTMRYEIVRTLPHFGLDAYPAVQYLAGIIAREEQRASASDTTLLRLCQQAIDSILSATPLCCRQEAPARKAADRPPQFIPAKNRAKIAAPELELLDQNGRRLKFKDLAGKPFALTFFYTRCVNPLKCAATVQRLGKLQQLAEAQGIASRVGIYGMTYDADFDHPSIMKSFGEAFGLSFSGQARFLTPQGGSEKQLFEQLALRVSYGQGSVNQHGIQLLLVDKKGRIACVYDNELWSASGVLEGLIHLLNE